MSSSSNKATRSPKKIVHHQDCMMREKKDCYIELLSTKFISDQDRCFAALFIQSSHSPLYCYSLLYSSLLIHQAGAYPSSHVAWSDQKFYYSPLNGMPVHPKVTPPPPPPFPPFHQAPLTICQYPFIFLGRERGSMRAECLPQRKKHNALARSWTWTSKSFNSHKWPRQNFSP